MEPGRIVDGAAEAAALIAAIKPPPHVTHLRNTFVVIRRRPPR